MTVGGHNPSDRAFRASLSQFTGRCAPGCPRRDSACLSRLRLCLRVRLFLPGEILQRLLLQLRVRLQVGSGAVSADEPIWLVRLSRLIMKGMARLTYTINPEYDWAMVKEVTKRHGFELGDKKSFLKDYRYADDVLKKTKLMYQKAWDEIGNFFFKQVEQITQHPWKFKKYECVLSLVHQGLSNWGGNKIVRSWAENPYSQRKITAHELIITYLWDYLDKQGYKKLPDKKKWAFCEITAWAITGLEKRLVQKCWPWITEAEKWPLKHNYPELIPLQKKIRPLYEKRTSFKRYAEKALKVITS